MACVRLWGFWLTPWEEKTLDGGIPNAKQGSRIYAFIFKLLLINKTGPKFLIHYCSLLLEIIYIKYYEVSYSTFGALDVPSAASE